MPNPSRGELSWTKDGVPVARITLQGKQRASYELTSCRTAEEAEERRLLLADLAARFRKGGVIGSEKARKLLETAASCSAALLPGIATVAAEILGSPLPERIVKVPTFREVAKEWTSGELHKRFPDEVRAKDSEIDAKRLATLCEIEVARGTKLGDLPIDRVTLDHALEAKRNLPADVKRPATRRHYAQLISRVMGLAVYPCRYIASNPLPKGFVPNSGKPPSFPYLYPAEDAALLACSMPYAEPVPLCYRVLFGFLAREGCREGEALAAQVRDFNLELGTLRLDENKSDDPREWALDPGVVRALRTWVKRRGAKPDDFMFVDENGAALTMDHRLAEVLRSALLAAGVDRRELHHDGTNTRKIRVHDLRGTFVTLALANGRTETWVADRTGHRSSQMINRYRRRARQASELHLGELLPLDVAIPELTELVTKEAPSPSDGPSGARPKGFEPLTSGLEIHRSIQLSYGRKEVEGAELGTDFRDRQVLRARSEGRPAVGPARGVKTRFCGE